jgi:hypothetical protein
MRSPCCLCLCASLLPINFWMFDTIFMKLDIYIYIYIYIMAFEPIPTGYFINPPRQSVCLYMYPTIVAGQRLGRNVTATTNTLATCEDLAIASTKLQTISKIDDWTKKWRIKTNLSKSTRIHPTQPNLSLKTGNVDLPQKNEVKYLSMHLDRWLTWGKHIKKKKTFQPKSETNALPTRKINTINWKQTTPIQSSTQPLWACGIQLSGTASSSSIEIL